MSQVQSEKITFACDWNMAIEGSPNPAGIPLGLTINPGVFIEATYFNLLAPLVTSGNPAIDTFSIAFVAPSIFTSIISDTIDNINALFLNDWYSGDRGPYPARVPIMQNFFPIATPGDWQIKAFSSAPMTSGRVLVNYSCIQMYIH